MSADSRGSGTDEGSAVLRHHHWPVVLRCCHYPSNHAAWVRHSSECHQSTQPWRPGMDSDRKLSPHGAARYSKRHWSAAHAEGAERRSLGSTAHRDLRTGPDRGGHLSARSRIRLSAWLPCRSGYLHERPRVAACPGLFHFDAFRNRRQFRVCSKVWRPASAWMGQLLRRIRRCRPRAHCIEHPLLGLGWRHCRFGGSSRIWMGISDFRATAF